MPEVNAVKKRNAAFRIVLILVVAVLPVVWHWDLGAFVSQDAGAVYAISATSSDPQAHLEEIAKLIARYTGDWEFRLTPRSKLQLTHGIIEISGTDGDGPVYLVLTKTRGHLYRNGGERCVNISKARELYQGLSPFIG
jgi:hypothetical protein